MDINGLPPWGASDDSIAVQLARRAATDGAHPYAVTDGRTVTITALDAEVDRVAAALDARGVRPGDRVALMLANSLEHIVLFFALLRLGACQVPVNVHLRGAGLEHILTTTGATALVAETDLGEALAGFVAGFDPARLLWRGGVPAGLPGGDLAALWEYDGPRLSAAPVDPDATVYICFTSGTTGLPKGVMVSDRMLRVAAHAAGRLGDLRRGDVFHMWEPFYHIGGAEVLVLAVQQPITLALIPRFSASRFWDQARAVGATHIHFLGGVLALLLKQPPRPDDRDHSVRVAWGGGCPPAVWRAFEERFGVSIRECYGMTECSSFATQNVSGKVGSVGNPLPWLDVVLVDDDGRPVPEGERGEIWLRERVPGVLTKGYWGNPEATAALFADGWLRTGDLGAFDADGDMTYLGRKKDSLRRRGENVSAFEVERVLNEHPAVEESAVVGVRNELDDEDIKAFLQLKPGAALDPLDLVRWCEGRLAYFQIPRYVAIVEAFEKTPSLRIRKELLPRDTNCFDLEATGYVVKR